jgi:CheY-like chemotaxis protein
MSEQASVRVLLVEDEAFVAMLLEEMIAELGHRVVGTAHSLEAAERLAREADFDLAILDINVHGKRSYPVAEILRTRSIPFIFATGYGAAGLDAGWKSAPALQKPFQLEDLGPIIASTMQAAASRS